ncbi:Hypothetical protein HVR_LOCUS76 [uncultured virus]|nr:Hypothetical protein HVR_LOCUS76 [uncultured virus]
MELNTYHNLLDDIRKLVMDFQTRYNVSDSEFSKQTLKMMRSNGLLKYDSEINKREAFRTHYIVCWFFYYFNMVRNKAYNPMFAIECLNLISDGHLSMEDLFSLVTLPQLTKLHPSLEKHYHECGEVIDKLIEVSKLDVLNMTTSQLRDSFVVKMKEINHDIKFKEIILLQMSNDLYDIIT